MRRVWVLAGFVLAGCVGCEGTPSGEREGMAKVMCEEFVGERLKSPGSAEFSGVSAESLGGVRWRVSGVVDSQNSFGGLVRSEFSCVLEGPAAVGGVEWVAESVVVG